MEALMSKVIGPRRKTTMKNTTWKTRDEPRNLSLSLNPNPDHATLWRCRIKPNQSGSNPIKPISARPRHAHPLPTTNCIPLNVHSHYSFLDSTLSPTAIIELARQHRLPAVALTDTGN